MGRDRLQNAIRGSLVLLTLTAATIAPAWWAPGEASSAGDSAVVSASDSTSAGGSSHAAATTPVPLSRRHAFLFTPGSGEDCATFAIMEASVSWLGREQHNSGRWLGTNSLGLMVNVGRWSFGGAFELHWACGRFPTTGSVRVRRWFTREQSLELAASYLQPGPDVDPHTALSVDEAHTRLGGPMVSLRYSPAPIVYFQGGACRFRETSIEGYDAETYRPRIVSRSFWKGHAGIGVAGPPGAAMWGMEALIALIAVAVFAAIEGMYSGY